MSDVTDQDGGGVLGDRRSWAVWLTAYWGTFAVWTLLHGWSTGRFIFNFGCLAVVLGVVAVIARVLRRRRHQ